MVELAEAGYIQNNRKEDSVNIKNCDMLHVLAYSSY